MHMLTRGMAAILGTLAIMGAAHAAQVSVHDPVMAKEGDTYYLYSTGPGITFYSSKNMVDWQPEGRVFAGQPTWAKTAAPSFDDHVWAPDVQFHDGKYYLYYSVSGFGKNTSGIGVTVNTTLDPRSPDYRWVDQGMLLQSVPERDEWNAIDSNIITDKHGTPWMSFGSFWNGIKLVKLNADWKTIAEPQEWHSLARRVPLPPRAGEFKPAPEEIEAPFIFRRGDEYFLFVSWGLCCQKEKSTYHLAVGRAKSVTGPYLDRDGRDMAQGGGTVLLQGDKDWKGLGHNSAYTFDGKDYLVLHAYETADNYLQKLKILPMTWDKEGWPHVDPRDLNRYQSRELPAATAKP